MTWITGHRRIWILYKFVPYLGSSEENNLKILRDFRQELLQIRSERHKNVPALESLTINVLLLVLALESICHWLGVTLLWYV